MPTIFPPAKSVTPANTNTNSSTSTSTTPPSNNITMPNTPSPYVPAPAPMPVSPARNYWNDTGFDGWNDPYSRGMPAGNQDSKRLTPEEREALVKKLYKEILGREATARDINYHKYGISGEDEIRKQLISSEEFKTMISNATKYNEIKDKYNKTMQRNNQMEAQIKDQIEEFKKLLQLLNEKNKYIEKLRTELNNPYNIVK